MHLPQYILTRRDREQGFTLVELLVVVLIVGVLAAIAIPVYLNLQNTGHKSAVRADTNIKVKTMQAAITEGARVSDFYGSMSGSDKGSTITVQASTTTGAAANDFQVVGSESTTASPAGSIDYTYTYDSVTGKFTEQDGGALGAGTTPVAPVITTTGVPAATVGSSYSTTLAASGYPAATWTLVGGALPTGLSLTAATGEIKGTPTGANTGSSYPFTVKATNSAGTSPTKSYTMTLNPFTAVTIYDTDTSTFTNAFTGTTSSVSYSSSSTYLQMQQASYGASGDAYHTLTGLLVGHTYKLYASGGYIPAWSSINCASVTPGYGSATDTVPSPATSFTATATTMRVFVTGTATGSGTLRCQVNRYYVQQAD